MDIGRPTVRVDGNPVRLWPWSHWRDAILAHDPRAASALASGRAWIQDARGEPLDPGGAVVDGAEIRLVADIPPRDGAVYHPSPTDYLEMTCP